MKKIIITLMALGAALLLCACRPTVSPTPATEDGARTDSAAPPTAEAFAGPWHLDGADNDSEKLTDLFPGYGEWGAVMQIGADGSISCYIGAIGGSGTYIIKGETLTAELKDAITDANAAPQDTVIAFKIGTDGDEVTLTATIGETETVWRRGEAEDAAAGENEPRFLDKTV